MQVFTDGRFIIECTSIIKGTDPPTRRGLLAHRPKNTNMFACLAIDWRAIGLDAEESTLVVPSLAGFLTTQFPPAVPIVDPKIDSVWLGSYPRVEYRDGSPESNRRGGSLLGESFCLDHSGYDLEITFACSHPQSA